MSIRSYSASNSWFFLGFFGTFRAHGLARCYTKNGMRPFTTIDLHWTGRPESIASLLVESEGQRALIDPGPESTIETLREALRSRGLSFASLDSLLLTHIHLDHSGATGSIVRENPNLKVYVHRSGAAHMADPSRLLASAGRLYGADLKTLYGECLPVPEMTLRPLEGGETVRVGLLGLDVFYTPGHASHHVAYWDPGSRIAFVGDNAGIRIEGKPYLLPATPPPDIDLELWNASLDTIASLNPERLFLTHFGYIDHPGEHIRLYRERLRDWSALTEHLLQSTDSPDEGERLFIERISSEVRGVLPAEPAELYILNGGLGLSWRGLVRYLKKRSLGGDRKASA
jgi:glyoxylase-like metal-dependent hydrolase (beta-lactamase superfamily II)